jgi:hypothetical protein
MGLDDVSMSVFHQSTDHEKGSGIPMNRITRVMVMQSRDRTAWLEIPAFWLGAIFAICWCIVLLHDALTRDANGIFTFGLAYFYVAVLAGGFIAVTGTFPFAVSFGACRRDYLLGTLAMTVIVCAAWAIVLTLLSLVEADVIKNWGVGLHFFHLPLFNDGSRLRQFCWTWTSYDACARSDPSYLRDGLALAQFWVSFVLLLFMGMQGLLLGSIYQRFGRMGIYTTLGLAVLFLSMLVLVSSLWTWWRAIVGWLGQQTAASLAWWLLLPVAIYALASYALLRKATV